MGLGLASQVQTDAYITTYPDALGETIDCSGIEVQTQDWALRPGINKFKAGEVRKRQ